MKFNYPSNLKRSRYGTVVQYNHTVPGIIFNKREGGLVFLCLPHVNGVFRLTIPPSSSGLFDVIASTDVVVFVLVVVV